MNSSNIGAIYAFLFNLIVLIAYFSKKRVNTKETTLYKWLLITSLSGTILSISSYYVLTSVTTITDIVTLAPKIYLFNLLIWGTLFTMYMTSVAIPNNKQTSLKLYNTFFVIIGAVAAVLLFVLPLDIVSNGSRVYTTGWSQNVLYVLVIINAIIVLILIVINFKKIPLKKILPILTFVVISLLVFFVQYQNPSLFLITISITLNTTLMYHTIENPDVKMINKLEVAKAQAEKANNAKSDFLSSMSHEIRTPLNAIVGLSEYVNSKETVPEEIKGDLQDIVNASSTLLEIVGNILDINKIESEKMEITNVTYNFKEELRKIAKMNKTRVSDKGLVLNITIAKDIPYELIGDKVHVKSIINNLLSNAIKYTEKGEITINVNCINQNNICTLIISVRDTGRGIKADSINKLFEKFERLDIEKNSTTEGTGLGLAITKKIVELMGGKINAQSQYGQGSIFVVHLPQTISKLESDNIEEISNETPILNNQGKKILIVDDNNLNIKVAKKLLEGTNCIIEECTTGEECLTKTKDNSYDLILLDIMMPKMSGEEVLKKLKENNDFNTPVVALTADAVLGAKNKYIEEGFTNYLAKPFNKEQITNLVNTILK